MRGPLLHVTLRYAWFHRDDVHLRATRMKVAQNASRSGGTYRQMPTLDSRRKLREHGARSACSLRAIILPLLRLLLRGRVVVALEVLF
jgi:hypothetical protein